MQSVIVSRPGRNSTGGQCGRCLLVCLFVYESFVCLVATEWLHQLPTITDRHWQGHNNKLIHSTLVYLLVLSLILPVCLPSLYVDFLIGSTLTFVFRAQWRRSASTLAATRFTDNVHLSLKGAQSEHFNQRILHTFFTLSLSDCDNVNAVCGIVSVPENTIFCRYRWQSFATVSLSTAFTTAF